MPIEVDPSQVSTIEVDPSQVSAGGPEQSFGEALREYGRKMNPVAMLQGFGEAVRHPIDFVKNWTSQNQQLADQAETAWKEGRHVDAARHAANYLFNMIPGVGTASDEAGNKLQNGDIAGGLADSAALATQAAIGIKTPAIANATARGVTAAGVGLKAAAPDVLKGGAQVAAGEALAKLPGMELPARLALGYSGARQIGRGLRTGIAAGKAELFPKPLTPVTPIPLSEETPAPVEDTALLDSIARGQTGKAFGKLTPEAQATVRDIAQRINSGAAPEAATPVNRPGPQLVLPRQFPPKNIRDIAQQELGGQGNPPSGQDIIRGSSNIPLSEQGQAEAQRLAQATVGQFDKIYTSPLDRAQVTAKTVAATNPQAGAPEPTEALTPWYLGGHEGQPTQTVLAKMQDLIQNHPDEVPAGRGPQSTKPGQSFNDFKDEFLSHVQNQVENYEPGQKILNATHYRDTRVLQAWAKAGASNDFKVDVPTMLEKGEVKPGDMLHLNPQTMAVKAVDNANEPGIYFARHGATAWNAENGTPNPAESVGAPGPATEKVGFPAQRIPEGIPRLPFAERTVPQPPAAEVARLNAGVAKPLFETSGQELGQLYHGGKTELKNIDPSKLQYRDAGFYGKGLYVTKVPEYAQTYGPKLTRLNLDPQARVLIGSLKPTEAPPGLVDAVVDWADKQGRQTAIARGKEAAFNEELQDIRTSIPSWKNILDRFGDANGYDVIQHSPGEIVVKNPGVVRLNASARPPTTTNPVNPPGGTGMFLRNFDLDTMARALRSGLNKGSITKSQVSQVLNGQAQLELLRDQLGLKGRIPPNAASYLRGKVF